MSLSFVNTFLVFCAVVFLPYGLVCFSNPGMLAEVAGIGAESASGATELRAMYGGMQTSIGVMALVAFFRPTLVESFLVMLATVSVGLLTARLAGLLMDGGFNGYTGMALGFESVLASFSLFLLLSKRERS